MARILVVDDDVTVAELVSEVVSFLKHEPITMNDPVAVLAQYGRDSSIRAILSDYMMPHLTGLELFAALQETSPRVRRVLITAAPNEPEVREALKLGIAEMVIAKPPSIGDIRVALAWL